ncbi:MAG TPA: hypothetical protein VF593_03680 [Chthoniobacteraceae bacterium]
MPRLTRSEVLLFLATFLAFAWFNQGGGWNQNSRFAEVRAMVEEGRFAIDNFLIYRARSESDILQRLPLDHAEYTLGGKRHQLAWVDSAYNLFPVNDQPSEPELPKGAMIELCSSGDISYVPATGHFHPNKPPGTSLLGVPGYWLLLQVERALGFHPDHWFVVNVNAWLTSVLSVGIISAFGCVLFFRLAQEFAGGNQLAALLATLSFAFGTMFLPYGTIFFDHNVTATFLVAALYFIRRSEGRAYCLAGFCAGFAAITNYVAAVAVIILGVYLLLARRTSGTPRLQWRGSLLYSLGVLAPFLFICWYGWVCFGSPFRINNDFQNPLFKDPEGALGMFALPSGYVAALISVSPFRGLFFLSPVLIMGFYGWFVWLRDKTFVAEARLCLAMFAFFFLVNASFNGYHGGFAVGPRYLIPALPFIALPLVTAFANWRRLTGGLALISIVHQALLTITDAQSPVAVGSHARIESRPDPIYHLVAEYAWPLFAHGRAWPLLDLLAAARLENEADQLAAEDGTEEDARIRLENSERELRAAIDRGDPQPLMLGSIRGPVSVNPIGIYEGTFYQVFPAGTEQTRWASFNAGELLFPESRWSLFPLLLISGGLGTFLIRRATRL